MQLFLGLALLISISLTNSELIQLTDQNFQDTVSSTELVLVNFYADWCHFSRQLGPIFEETAKAFDQEYSPAQVKIARVDCESPNGSPLAQKFGVNKYPTLKLFRNGEMVKREYRGSRSVDAFKEYVRKEMTDPIEYASGLMQALKFEDKNRHLVVLIQEGQEGNQEAGRTLENVKKLARQMKDDCKFHAFVGKVPQSVIQENPYQVRFISPVVCFLSTFLFS